MGNFRLTIAYDGSRYNGWQRLGGSAGGTIQGRLEGVLAQLCGHPVEIQGAGRTDAGVHARAQVASVALSGDFTPEEVAAYLNRYLPDDIAVTDCRRAAPRFHARLSAQGKRYLYRLWTGQAPDVFRRKYLTPWREPLELAAMEEAAGLLLGRHDFRSFCANHRTKKSTVRTLTRLDIQRLGEEVCLTFEGDGFLYHMVRILTGTLLEVGTGKRPASSMPALLAARDRSQAGPTAPARGLILDEVFYPQEVLAL